MKNLLICIALLLSSCLYIRGDVEINKQSVDSVVMIRVETNTAKWVGTGFSIEKDSSGSDILTNKHICSAINEGEYTITDSSGHQYKAWYVKSDGLVDACIIRTQALINPLHLAHKDAKSGDFIQVIGAPHGLLAVYTSGYVSGYQELVLDDDIDGRKFYVAFRAQLMSAIISPGNSGSPVLDTNGNVVGIVFAGRGDSQQISFMVPVEEVRKFLNNKDKVKTPYDS